MTSLPANCRQRASDSVLPVDMVLQCSYLCRVHRAPVVHIENQHEWLAAFLLFAITNKLVLNRNA
ncbi:hypothetical protein CCM_00282 [Cordyceps militaris CM01]|uniref:Uncharacterized protein n=1 Tax=Cordyceps militaris (strain CM01) TaxID=983644 RepID=G3J345_CORMM|nr:uncharacterized protein CCM_00282 [Cordyceps militaris CM01]EGX95628.1 hypothetical protein CCM_00282 [Cordyceps militaris CM01]